MHVRFQGFQQAVFQVYREGWLKLTIGEILLLAQAKEAHQIQRQQNIIGKLLLQL
jgi:NADPH:quinone reductase-like Zn-dependent oxidoreductase